MAAIQLKVASGENAILSAFAEVDMSQKGIELTCSPISPADFWIGTSEKPQFIMIERKTFDDFASSLRSGHLQQQRERMRSELEEQKAAYIGFILEGEPKYRKNQYRQLDGVIENLIFDHRCFVLYSGSATHTRDIVLNICKKLPRYMGDECATKDAMIHIPGLKKKQMDRDAFPTHILSLIPGLSTKTATVLLTQYTLKQLSAMSIDEMKGLKISEKRALGQAMAEKISTWLASAMN